MCWPRCAIARNRTWTALEIAGNGGGRTLAAACAFRAAAKPGSASPPTGLTPQHGNHYTALAALHPLSTQRLDGHTCLAADVLRRLSWPTATYPVDVKRPVRVPLKSGRMPESASGFGKPPARFRTSACTSASIRSARHSPIPGSGASG